MRECLLDSTHSPSPSNTFSNRQVYLRGGIMSELPFYGISRTPCSLNRAPWNLGFRNVSKFFLNLLTADPPIPCLVLSVALLSLRQGARLDAELRVMVGRG